MFDREIFFDSVRESLFGGKLDQGQVDGMNAILFVWELKRAGEDLRHLSYMLATTFHETAATMCPIEEYGKGSGHDYGKPDPQTGQAYYGRGFVQLTWRDNYAKAARELNLAGTPLDMEKYAFRALDLILAAGIMFKGMSEGWFTGRKLENYFDAWTEDPVGARQIINPDDKGELVAGYYQNFLTAVHKAWINPEETIDAEQVAEAGPPDGGRRTRQEVRQEGRRTPKGRPRV